MQETDRTYVKSAIVKESSMNNGEIFYLGAGDLGSSSLLSRNVILSKLLSPFQISSITFYDIRQRTSMKEL